MDLPGVASNPVIAGRCLAPVVGPSITFGRLPPVAADGLTIVCRRLAGLRRAALVPPVPPVRTAWRRLPRSRQVVAAQVRVQVWRGPTAVAGPVPGPLLAGALALQIVGARISRLGLELTSRPDQAFIPRRAQALAARLAQALLVQLIRVLVPELIPAVAAALVLAVIPAELVAARSGIRTVVAMGALVRA
jgi:hypothetical protein